MLYSQTATIRNSFHTYLANNLANDVQYQRANYYFFIGGIAEWNDTDTLPLTQIADTFKDNKDFRSEMVMAKRIRPTDVSLVIPRYNWVTGTVFDQWDNTIDMNNKNFYCMTDEYRVYKCLNNNNEEPSTVSPYGKSIDAITLSDGYTWKYMYSITPIKQKLFVTEDYIPVQQAVTENFYNNGQITNVTIISEGSNYTYTPTTAIVLSNVTTTGAGATVQFTVNGVGGINTVTINTPGSGYDYGAKVTAVSATGSGAELEAIVGIIDSISVDAAGTGYVSPTVTISAPDNVTDGIQAVAEVSTLEVVQVTLVAAGTGYSANDIITLVGVGTGTAATITVLTVDTGGEILTYSVETSGSYTSVTDVTAVSVTGGTGNDDATFNVSLGIETISVTTEGAGYASAPTVTITDSSGINAAATAVLVNGIGAVKVVTSGVNYNSITDEITITVGGAILKPILSETGSLINVYIEYAGVGYTSVPTLTVSGVGGTGIYGNASAIVSAVVYNGEIVNVVIEDPGVNYPTEFSTYITITGDGTGAKFSPVINNNGQIIDVVAENLGNGYTYADATVFSSSGSGATLKVIIDSIDMNTDQSVIEQTTIDGAIYAIKVTQQGSSYTGDCIVTVTGNGVGFAGTPIIDEGSIIGVTVTNPGYGYTYANVVFSDPNRNENVMDESTKAYGYAVLSVPFGHGYNAPYELLANKVQLSATFSNNVVGSNVLQEYRKFGILRAPTDLITNVTLKTDFAPAYWTIRLDTTANLVKDEILIIPESLDRYKVADFSGTIAYLIPLDSNTRLPSGAFNSSGIVIRTYTIVEIISSPTINKFSGELIMISNEERFSFVNDQAVTLKTFIEL